jgi:hypothetical protein
VADFFFFFFFLKIIVIYNVVKVAIRVFNHVLYSSARKNGHKDVIVSDGFFPIVVVVSFFFLFFFFTISALAAVVNNCKYNIPRPCIGSLG